MSSSRIKKIKTSPQISQDESDLFFMSLEEAKAAIIEKYDYLADRYERRYPKQKPTG